MSRIAVVLFNLGGPDGPAAVRPFLRNLFSDPAIIAAPALVRLPLAELISRTREGTAKANYAIMGGGSPILKETQAQADALEAALVRRRPADETRVFIAMRYWNPRAGETARAVRDYGPDHVVLAPLYPQYSTTTTASSLKEWRARFGDLCSSICCWYGNTGLIEAHVRRIQETWAAAGEPRVRLIFSAHGLPKRTSDAGDPYRWQIEQSCAAIAARLGPGWDWTLSFQSRVGPLEWIGPSTSEAIEQAARDGVGVLIDPVAFVSEHVETLVELDHEYAELARELNLTPYLRAPAVGVEDAFIEGLAAAVERSLARKGPHPDGEPCPPEFARCGARV